MKCCTPDALKKQPRTITLTLDRESDEVVYSKRPENRLDDEFEAEVVESVDKCSSISRLLKLV